MERGERGEEAFAVVDFDCDSRPEVEFKLELAVVLVLGAVVSGFACDEVAAALALAVVVAVVGEVRDEMSFVVEEEEEEADVKRAAA